MSSTHRHLARSVGFAFLCAGAWFGCAPTGTEPPPTRDALLPVFAMAPSYVARITLTFKGSGITDSLMFVIPTTGTAVDTLEIRAGSNRSITALAYDSGGSVTHRADTTVNLVPGPNPVLRLTLTPLTGSIPIDITFGSLDVVLFGTDSGGRRFVRRSFADGSGLVSLTPDTATKWDQEPVLRPGRRLVAFTRYSGSPLGLWVMDISGANRTLVTADGGDANGVSWTPDGSRILYQPYVYCGTSLYSVRPDGSGEQVLVQAGTDITEPIVQWPSVSVTGRIAFVGIHCGAYSGNLYFMNADRSGLTMAQSNVVEAKWSPDGTRLVLERQGTGGTEVWTMNADGTGLTQVLAVGSAVHSNPAWSPDGTQIVYSNNCELHVMNADGSGDHVFTPKRGSACDNVPNWVRIG